MKRKQLYFVPANVKLFKSNYDYYNGIGKLTQAECIDKSMHVSGVRSVESNEYEDYIQHNRLHDIFKTHD